MDHITGGFRVSTSNDSLFPSSEEIKNKKNVIFLYKQITPEIAKEYLQKCNIQNRKARSNWVSHLATLMKDGRWNEGVPSIVPFAMKKNGGWILLDKQHTLQSIIVANRPTWLLLGFGFPESSMDVIDQNHKRTTGDVFKLRGHTLSCDIDPTSWRGAAIQAVWMGASDSEARLHISELMDFIDEDEVSPALEFIFNECITHNVKRFTMAPVVGCFVRCYLSWKNFKHLFENKKDFENRLKFASKILMESSANIEEYNSKNDSAMMSLRARLSDEYAGKSMGIAERREVYLFTWKALDLFLHRKESKKLTLTDQEYKRIEPYPIDITNTFRTPINVDPAALIKSEIEK